MLVVRGNKQLGKARIASTFVFARGAWMNVIDRDGLVLDTRFAPAARSGPRAGTCVYLLHRGTFTLHGGSSFTGPSCFVMSEQVLEGADGSRDVTFRAAGSPFSAMEMHFAATDVVRGPDAQRPVPLDLDDSTWAAIARAIERSREGADEARVAEAVGSVLGTLATSGVVTARVADDARAPIPFEKLWRAVRPLADRFALSATLDQVGSLVEASPRQIDRYFRDFFRAFPMVGGSWRGMTVHLRLKLAVMFLSADDVTVADVARAVGYGSTEAMARAFRDAALPPPSAIREALRER